MNEKSAILAAICANPQEDTPRLAFADWLDENGQPERAAYIRFEVELATRKHFDGFAASKERTVLLAACPQILPRGLGLQGKGWHRQIGRRGVGVMSRGMVQEVHTDAAFWLEWSDAIVAEHPIRRVRLTTMVEMLRILEGGAVSLEIRHRMPRSFVWQHEYRNRTQHDIISALLAAEWPNITFELPPPPMSNIIEGIAGERISAGAAVYLSPNNGRYYNIGRYINHAPAGISTNNVNPGAGIRVQTVGGVTFGITANDTAFREGLLRAEEAIQIQIVMQGTGENLPRGVIDADDGTPAAPIPTHRPRRNSRRGMLRDTGQLRPSIPPR